MGKCELFESSNTHIVTISKCTLQVIHLNMRMASLKGTQEDGLIDAMTPVAVVMLCHCLRYLANA